MVGPLERLRSISALFRRLALLAGLVLAGVLLAACQHPGETDAWGDRLQPDAGEIRGLTPEHPRSHPSAIHLDEARQEAYITLGGSLGRPDDRIAVVDLERGRLLAPINVGLRPLHLAQDPQDPDRLFVAHAYSPSISVIDKESKNVLQILDAVHYIERIAFTRDGELLLASDRANDRLIVYEVEREGRGYRLEETATIRTGPNPEAIEIIPPPEGADWDDDRLVAVIDRHGGSITLVDLETQDRRRIGTGGPPMELAARDGLLFVSGVGPGDGTPMENSGTPETGTADLENSLLVIDLRMGPAALNENTVLPMQRYISDTARPDNGPSETRILGGALPRALLFDDRPLPSLPGQMIGSDATVLWVGHHSSDQVQALSYQPLGRDDPLESGLLTTRNGAHGMRLSHLDEATPLGPRNLTDTIHGIFETPPGPRGIARVDDLLLVVAQYPEQLHVTDLGDCPGIEHPMAPCSTRTIDLVDDPVPYPQGEFERGERLFASAFPSADQDRSAIMCHPEGLATGGTWALEHRDLEPMKIPRLDQVADDSPWLIDGSVQRPEDYLKAAAGDMLQSDPDDPHNLAVAEATGTDPEDNMGSDADGPAEPDEQEDEQTHDDNHTGTENRIVLPENRSLERDYPGATHRLRMVDPDVQDPEDWMRLSFAYLIGERRVPPPPPFIATPAGQDLERGLRLFQDTQVGCAACHIGGGTRGNLLDEEKSEEIPRPPNATRIKAPAMNSVWDRETTGLLWDRHVPRVQSAILPTGHQCLIEDENGLEEPWHGDASGRTCNAIDTLAAYVRALET